MVAASIVVGCSSSAPAGHAATKKKAPSSTHGASGSDAGSASFFGNPGQSVAGPNKAPPDAGLPPFLQDSCGPGCMQSNTGAGTNAPFDVTGNPSDHVGLDPDGALVLQRDTAASFELIWIANTKEYTVSKVDTASFTELARYKVPVNDQVNGSENGPSRTSVDSEGSVYAGDRYGDNLTKISALGDKCPDTNGDGKVTTSSGPKDVLPLGQDDCLIWSTSIAGDARGVAVQEIPSQYTIDDSKPDQPPTVTEVPGARYVWTGGQENTFKLHKIDADTGKILLTLDPPPGPTYGLAVDGRGNLWMSAKNANALVRLDTTRCVDASCQKEKVCVTPCSETSCPTTCDSAVLERIDLMNAQQGSLTPYGITVDCMQRVWLGGAWGGNGVIRYDPLAAADARLKHIEDATFNALSSMPFDDNNYGIHGIAADAAGWVWGAGDNTGVWRIDAETLKVAQVAGTGGMDFSAKGMAVDRQGKVWAIPLRQDYAMVITPGMTINDATVQKPISGLGGPYTYSDMTGEQRRLASNDPGSYRQTFEGCQLGDKPTQWGDLSWDADTPTGTLVLFFARTADTAAALKKATWFQLGFSPGGKSPLPIGPYITGAGQTAGRLLEVEVRLITTMTGSESKDRCTSVPAVTPRVKTFGVTRICETNLN
ncbi:MAG: hypothetical protein ACHQ53_01430 [Polyangiales bacterium]